MSDAQLRIDNERYLREHPELSDLLQSFMTRVLQERPEHPLQFAVDFFTVIGPNAPQVTVAVSGSPEEPSA
jgi:hypothetical protein